MKPILYLAAVGLFAACVLRESGPFTACGLVALLLWAATLEGRAFGQSQISGSLLRAVQRINGHLRLWGESELDNNTGRGRQSEP